MFATGGEVGIFASYRQTLLYLNRGSHNPFNHAGKAQIGKWVGCGFSVVWLWATSTLAPSDGRTLLLPPRAPLSSSETAERAAPGQLLGCASGARRYSYSQRSPHYRQVDSSLSTQTLYLRPACDPAVVFFPRVRGRG